LLNALAHTCYIVRDLDAAEVFYRDRLGLTHAFDFVDDSGARYGVYLHVAGRAFVELFRGDPQPVSGGSYQHLCLEVDDLEAMVTDLRASGVEVTDPFLGSDQSWQSWVSDPDGNRIELHCYTEESLQNAWLR
jgi:lactoylglutathione lyase